MEKMNIQLSKRISQSKKYAFAAIDEKVAELTEQGVQVIDFGVGDPQSPPHPFVIISLSTFAETQNTTGYPSYIGSLEYRNACANYMKREFDVSLDPKSEICSTIGSKEAVFN